MEKEKKGQIKVARKNETLRTEDKEGMENESMGWVNRVRGEERGGIGKKKEREEGVRKKENGIGEMIQERLRESRKHSTL